MRDHRPRNDQRRTGPRRPDDERERRKHRGDKPFKPDRGDRKRQDRGGTDERPFKPREQFGAPAGERFRKRPRRAAPRLREGRVVLYGWHTVKAALENPARQVHRLLASDNAARRLAQELDLKLTPEIVRNEALDALAGPEAVHQGVVAEADALASPAIEDLTPQGLVLVLDQITDPHNVGAILRTAAAFAVEAVVTTERHSPEATGVLAKAASGALEYVPVITVVNLARGLEALKDKDVLLVGLDSSGECDLMAAPLRAPLALVLGAEGKGLRHLTRTTCDLVARLDLPGKIKSLNVSNATALALQIANARLRG
jgi:23S rRNA (guanosine2251-2'-O)-methyltransferase